MNGSRASTGFPARLARVRGVYALRRRLCARRHWSRAKATAWLCERLGLSRTGFNALVDVTGRRRVPALVWERVAVVEREINKREAA